jgi:hypothetical protein
LAECEEYHTLTRVTRCKSLGRRFLNPKENIAMKKNPKNQDSAPQKEDSVTKKDDELQEDELNKVTGGMRKAPGNKASGLISL